MQWSAAPHAGFTKPEAKPWMRVNDDYTTCNAEAQLARANADTLSVWQFWQRCLATRKQHKDVFVYGDFELIDRGHERVFAYVKTGAEAGRWLVVLNFSGDALDWTVPESVRICDWVLGNYSARRPEQATAGAVELRPWEGLLGTC
jgi:oligo-1,6-glucosidase